MARPDVSEERKNQILDAAAVVFSRRSFHQARIDDIASEAGLSKGAIYWYFKSKDDIIMALVERVVFAETQELPAILGDESRSARERLLYLTRYFSHATTRSVELLPLIYEFYAFAARQDKPHPFFQAMMQRFREILLPLIQQGIDRGEFRPVDPEVILITYSALYEGLEIIWKLTMDKDRVQMEELTRQSMQLLLDGLLNNDTST
jgi:AcrR family transcriptional regulator